jgi:putative membrane protein
MLPLAVLHFLTPWEIDPLLLGCEVLLGLAYWRGTRTQRHTGLAIGFWRQLSFYLGIGFTHLALLTHWDYYAQHMFFIHRAQHLMLHHVAPALLVLGNPWPILFSGTPRALQQALRSPAIRRPWDAIYGFLQQPVLAGVLFVATIDFWLIPPVHFAAMLNPLLYRVMNWSMLLDGLLFWWLIFDPRPKPPAPVSYGIRILVLIVIVIPQILVGAVIVFARHDLFPVYDLCGRVFAISPLTDQQIGGVIIWDHASTMSVIACLIVLSRYRRAQPRGGRRSGSAAAASLPRNG